MTIAGQGIPDEFELRSQAFVAHRPDSFVSLTSMDQNYTDVTDDIDGLDIDQRASLLSGAGTECGTKGE